MFSADYFRQDSLLDPSIAFLNHGSFGATPRPVFEEYQRIQQELEAEPVRFLGREIFSRLKVARNVLSEYVKCDADDLIFIENATTGVNMIARSLKFESGDEILTCSHEYGACLKAWKYYSGQSGAVIRSMDLPNQIESKESIVSAIAKGFTEKTKLLFLSHITSPTALRLPIEELIAIAKARDVRVFIDGAHAPSYLDLDLSSIGADYYTGNLHKWLSAPKGAAFLFVQRELQSSLEPFIVSWGWESTLHSGNDFLDHNEWTGTRDPSAFLAVPSAIEYQRAHDWSTVRARCIATAKATKLRLLEVDGVTEFYPQDDFFSGQMVAVELPKCDIATLSSRLFDEFGIEVVCWHTLDRYLLRFTVAHYTRDEELDRLVNALKTLLPEVTTGQ